MRSAPPGAEALGALDLPPVEDGGEGVGGGWFGHLGFGLGRSLERLPAPPPRPDLVPLANLLFYDHVLRLDSEGRWWFEALVTEARRSTLTARRIELERRLRAGAGALPWRVAAMRMRAPGAQGHLAAVAECVERIGAGEIFQANVCLRLDGELHGSALDAFAAASERLDPSYAAYLERPWGSLLSFSPELFLRRRGREVTSAPIKGTAPRGGGDADAERARLAASAKDVAENVMIVDLMRNDLGRVCRFGSIEASPAPEAEAHPGVWHLVSRVRGELREEVTDAELVRATFPPGSVTGAPKIQALKVISALEATGREAYTGAIGYVSPAAGLELNVAIRTFELKGRRLWLGSGGGVVADSRPRAELDEALQKARPLVRALGSRIEPPRTGTGSPGPAPPPFDPRPEPARGVLETVAVSEGTPAELDAHLARLAASVGAVYGLELPGDLAERCRRTAGRLLAGPGRLRLTARPSGANVEVELAADTTVPRIVKDAAHLLPLTLAGGLGEHKWADRHGIALVEKGGHLPLLVDLDGEVLEAGSANVWAVEGRRLVTPPADGRLLPGVVRAAVLARAAGEGLEAVEEPIGLERLRGADGIVLTSSLRVAREARLGDAPATPAAVATAERLRALLRAPAAADLLVARG